MCESACACLVAAPQGERSRVPALDTIGPGDCSYARRPFTHPSPPRRCTPDPTCGRGGWAARKRAPGSNDAGNGAARWQHVRVHVWGAKPAIMAQECWVCRPASWCRSKESKHLGLEAASRSHHFGRFWPLLVDFGSVSSLFEVFQTCENLYYASWTHVTSLERLQLPVVSVFTPVYSNVHTRSRGQTAHTSQDYVFRGHLWA